MSIKIFFECCLFFGILLNIWFSTDFFAYYCKLFKVFLPKKIYQWLLIDEYFKQVDYNVYIDFLYYKRSYSKNFLQEFLLKIFSCKICLSFWVSILLSIYFFNILLCGVIFFIIRTIDTILKIFLKI